MQCRVVWALSEDCLLTPSATARSSARPFVRSPRGQRNPRARARLRTRTPAHARTDGRGTNSHADAQVLVRAHTRKSRDACTHATVITAH